MQVTDEKLETLSKDELINLVKSIRQKLRCILEGQKDSFLATKKLIEERLEESKKAKEDMEKEIDKLSDRMSSAAEGLSKLYGGEKWKRINPDEKYLSVLKAEAEKLGDTKEMWIVSGDNKDKYVIGGNYWETVLHYWKTHEGPNFKGSIFDYADEAFQDGEEVTDEAMLASVKDIIDSNNIIQKVTLA